MLALIPTAWKIGGIAFLAALLVGGYFAWAAHQRALGAAAVEIADAKAIAKQRETDAALSAKLVKDREDKIRALEASAQQVREVIRYIPTTTSCGPSVGNAAEWVRGALKSAPAR